MARASPFRLRLGTASCTDHRTALQKVRPKDPFFHLMAVVDSFPNLRKLNVEGDWSTTVQAPQLLNSNGGVGEDVRGLGTLIGNVAHHTNIQRLLLTNSDDCDSRTTTAVTFYSDRTPYTWAELRRGESVRSRRKRLWS